MNKTCRLLSNGYKFYNDVNNNLFYKPCCMFKGPVMSVNSSVQDHKKYREMLNSIDSYNSKFCEDCNYQKSNNIRKSWRESSFDIVPIDAKVDDASYVEIQIDKTCNGGCIICSPLNSSYISKELGIFSVRNKQSHLEEILNLININTAKKLQFVGGEPFLSDIDIKVFERIETPNQVEVQYTTNGSIYPSEEKIKYWKQFKNVIINFSIDAVGDKFNYIRYPLDWKKVETNIAKMKQELPLNITFKINHTVNILNLYYYDEFLNWYNSVFLTNMKHNVIAFTFNPAWGELNPTDINSKLYNFLCQKYPPDSPVIRTVVNVNKQDFNIPYKIVDNDGRRSVNWKTVFPEIATCFD